MVCVLPGDGGVFDCQPPLPGCECKAGQPTIECLPPGADPTVVASCEKGQSTCDTTVNKYGTCERVPDLNCENVGVSGPGAFDPNASNSDQVVLGPEGELILDPNVQQVSFGFLWIANTGENTVSKIDIDTGKEVARYASVTGSNALGIPAVPLGGFGGTPNACGNCPSRTAIDFHGDAFVANRAFGEQATVTKYGNEMADCKDRNGNGVIDTSSDLNGDGRIDVDSPSEFLAEDDECILWTVPVGNNGGVARALAIDAGGPDGENGNVWVGLFNERRLVKLSGDTGAPSLGPNGQPVSVTLNDGTNRLQPYGAIADGNGNIWATGITGENGTVYIAQISAAGGTLTALFPVPDDKDGCSENYGITVDVDQNVWVGGWECKDAKRFTPSTQQWVRVDRNDLSNTRGIATDIAGNVWVAYTDGKVGKFKIADVVAMGDNAPGQIYTLPRVTPGPRNPTLAANHAINNTIGVGIDRNGACWAVSRNDGVPVGMATRIKPDGTMESFEVGGSPYTYSDFTGFGLFTVVRPTGFWRGNVKGCAADPGTTKWLKLTWTEIEPPGTSVTMRVRVADTIAGLATAPWFGPFDVPPVDLAAAGIPDSVYMQVEVQLSTQDTAVTPSFAGFELGFDCPGIGGVD